MGEFKYIILDDDEAFCFWLESKIKKHIPDFELIGSYHSTLEGILSISREKPDILFLDMNIDGLNGVDVLELMKYEPATIVISSDQHDMKEFENNANIYGFLKKPFAMDDLSIIVDKIKDTIGPK